MFLRVCLIAVLVMMTGLEAEASKYRSKTLVQRGAWTMVVTLDTSDGDAWCSAESKNASGQVFSLVGYNSGSFAISVFDPRWNLRQGDADFRIDVDRNRWDINGKSRQRGFSVSPSNAEQALKFIRQVRKGNNVRIYDGAGGQLARFSLKGSSFVVGQLGDCWNSIVERRERGLPAF